MKRLMVPSVTMAVMLLTLGALTPSYTQPPSKDDTPTFYHLVPGTYVNGWPRFTIHYPKDWVEVRTVPWEPFRAAAPGPTHEPAFAVGMGFFPQPLEKFVDYSVQNWKAKAQDVAVVSDKPSAFKDGTPAREFELRMILNGVPHSFFAVATKKGDLAIAAVAECSNEKIGEDLKAMAYSLEFQPGFDDPVKVPPDVQEFIDKSDNDYVSHDLAKYMTHFSDAFLSSGVRKGEVERFSRQVIGFATSAKTVFTDFVPAGDTAHYAGFSVINGTMKYPTQGMIIKEKGEWEWYGNQRDVAP